MSQVPVALSAPPVLETFRATAAALRSRAIPASSPCAAMGPLFELESGGLTP
jgi:hypothetical protein